MEYLAQIFTIQNILMMNVGVAAGIIIGALPGLSVVLAVTVLLPFTYGMEPLSAIYLLLGAYCAGNYGGSVTAILINTPGTPAASATTLDGSPLAKAGRSGDALRCSLIASVTGGLVSSVILLFAAPALASIALKFGPADYFALCIFGLSVVVSICSESVLKGVIMAAVGLLMSTVGIDPIDGISRFRFGRFELLGGFEIAAVMLGAFAVSEILMKTANRDRGVKEELSITKATIKIREILRKHWKTLTRSSLIGTFVGIVPGTGGPLAAFLSYNLAKSFSREPETFGEGNIDGVLAPEAGNNGVTGGALVPMLTLGLPGDTCMAVLLGALTMQGITPGPQLFTKERMWVYCLMLGLFLINLFMLVQGNIMGNLMTKVAKVPPEVLIPCIMIFCMLGGYAIRNYYFDVFIVMLFGIFGYIFRKFHYPIPPLAIGIVLGNLAETNLRRAMVLSGGSVSIFFTSPISLVFIIISAVFLFRPFLSRIWKKLLPGHNVENGGT